MEFDFIKYEKNKSKKCQECGETFYKRKRDAAKQWEDRECCSMACKNRRRSKLISRPVEERFFKFFHKGSVDDCWNWNGSTSKGYGQINSCTGKTLKAYRLSYEIHKGSIPRGLVVRHTCDNPSCVNPNHLVIGTQKDNAMDMARRGRINPKSLLNLRPGSKGMSGAGKCSNLELGRNVK